MLFSTLPISRGSVFWTKSQATCHLPLSGGHVARLRQGSSSQLELKASAFFHCFVQVQKLHYQRLKWAN